MKRLGLLVVFGIFALPAHAITEAKKQIISDHCTQIRARVVQIVKDRDTGTSERKAKRKMKKWLKTTGQYDDWYYLYGKFKGKWWHGVIGRIYEGPELSADKIAGQEFEKCVVRYTAYEEDLEMRVRARKRNTKMHILFGL